MSSFLPRLVLYTTSRFLRQPSLDFLFSHACWSRSMLGATDNSVSISGLSLFVAARAVMVKWVARHNPVKLIDLEELVNLLVHWYENMPSDARALLPLQKMYVPE
ncbi:hypothetical protein B1693_02920 [Geobacillus zalihae]|nr:hypothetical protein B1693_02920 [Geobacillus zalihae]